MTIREDYLGCRVSERRYPVSHTVFSQRRFSSGENRPKVGSDNGPVTPDQIEGKFENDAFKVFYDAYGILLSKHHDYGPTNIANAPGGALNGLRVRIHDKTARINNLIDNGKSAQHESLRDSFLDLLNYAAIALLVIDGNWPGCEPDDTEADCG